MLHRRMDVPKIPLQAMLPVDRIRPRSMEHEVHRPHRFVHTMGNRQARLRGLATWIWRTSAHGLRIGKAKALCCAGVRGHVPRSTPERWDICSTPLWIFVGIVSRQPFSLRRVQQAIIGAQESEGG